VAGLIPGGGRSLATESWAIYNFGLTNPTDTDRRGRVLLAFDGKPNVQYGRDAWVPARSILWTWMLVGPAPPQPSQIRRDLQFSLYDRRDGQDHLLLPPPGQERTRSRSIIYEKRQPTTALLFDEDLSEWVDQGQLPQPQTSAEQVIQFVRTFRASIHLSERIALIGAGSLSPIPEGLDGIDHLVITSDRLPSDPAGLLALRQWLEQGGRIWVMLDRVRPETIAPLLGRNLDFHVVDRVGLTSFQVESQSVARSNRAEPKQEREQPVDFVRVLLPAQERVLHTINGWPVWFERQVGRGKIFFTALGAPGWYRPRTARDSASPYSGFPSLPIPLNAFELFAEAIQGPVGNNPFQVDSFQTPLTEQIGYSIVSRGRVSLVFGSFLLVTLVLGLIPPRKAGANGDVKRSGGLSAIWRPPTFRYPELFGWLGPAAALGATVVFVGMGHSSRHAAAPTVGVAQVVDGLPGHEEASVQGLLAVYRPDPGPVNLRADRGGFFDLDMAGTEGQERRLVVTDMDAWHWEHLDLPAGVRLAPFHGTVSTNLPITAIAHFGPDGLEGKFNAGPFRDPGDALISPAGIGERNLAVRLRPDGTFSAGSPDVLPAGQYLASQLLTDDRQQRRRDLYEEFIKGRGAGRLDGRNVLLAWADPVDLHFTLADEPRQLGGALLVMPLQLERPLPGTRLTVPAPLIPVNRMVEGGLGRPPQETSLAMDMDLRFQLPDEILPFRVEHARLATRIDAPARRVTVSGLASEKATELLRLESPLDQVHVDITDERFLHLDRDGGLHVQVAVSELLEAARVEQDPSLKKDSWRIDYLEMEVSGQALSK
jgi:hypothetical protein